MGHCHASLLASRGVLRVRGADARKYLQGLITNDIGKAQGAGAIHAGLLSPQGKILFDFFAVPARDGFLIDVAQDKADELLKRLAFYRLRAQVEIVEEPSLVVAAAWGGTPRPPEGAIVYADPRLPELGFRILVAQGASAAVLGCEPATEEDYHAFRVRQGVPEGGRDYAFSEVFPHEALFDQLNGVDFAKGCYVGQEVVSRMEHRGTARSRILPVRLGGPAPAKGSDIRCGDKLIGTLLSSSGHAALAFLRLDKLAEANAPLLTEGVSVAVQKPDWVRYEVPGVKDT
ncbi:MAG: YgfZ/GcvT domain-containing protein, partial [Methyloceanibacter sp.]